MTYWHVESSLRSVQTRALRFLSFNKPQLRVTFFRSSSAKYASRVACADARAERPFVTESASNNTRCCRLHHYFLPFDRRACTPRVFWSWHGRKVRVSTCKWHVRQTLESPYLCVYSPDRRLPLKDIVSQEFKFIPKPTRNAPIARDNFPWFARVTRARAAIFLMV